MTDILDLLILILLINLLAMVGSSRTGKQKSAATISIDWGRYAPWFTLVFFEVFGGWFLFPAVIAKIDEIVAIHPELASGPNGFIIIALPFVMAGILALMPISFLLSRREI